jgi:hypothetical protein
MARDAIDLVRKRSEAVAGYEKVDRQGINLPHQQFALPYRQVWILWAFAQLNVLAA